jgi:hypothetical protein
MIFRNSFMNLHVGNKSRDEIGKTARDPLSRKIGDAWKLLTPEEKQHYAQLAKLKWEEHERTYPNYQYRRRGG